MFSGEHINTTEDRAVLHVALRMPPGSELHVDGQDVVGDVQAVLDKMGDLSDRISEAMSHWSLDHASRFTFLPSFHRNSTTLGRPVNGNIQ